MITNEQKLNILKAAEGMESIQKRIMMGVVFYLEQHPEAELPVALRASQLECAIVLYRERWFNGWTNEDIKILTTMHVNTIRREIKRRGLSTTTDPSSVEYYKR